MNVSYFGYLPKGNQVIGGGEVKTKSVLKALREYGGFDRVNAVDTSNWKKNIFSLLWKLIVAACRNDVIVFVSATSSFQAVLPILNCIQKFNGLEIHFIPVGNCMTCHFQTESRKRQISKVKGIYCQTETMANALINIGIKNACVMHNFKFITSYCQRYESGKPYKLVYFSRISEEKGIFECIDVIQRVNADAVCCTLDIYGKIDECIKARFEDRIREDENIQYLGNAAPEDSSMIMKEYYLAIFPTKYEGEGFPGTIIDNLAAGIPVLSSRFGGYSDILRENEDSICFEFEDYVGMYEKLEYALNHPEIINEMRKTASEHYLKYTPENEIKVLLTNMRCRNGRKNG